ncbi:growth/differentiation factor 15-like [Pristis pectinata]|uniref:growth/differentiation factor 15-like n=1 Tax=Pristis pectinata TaxID=685728 RepID=UPI00223D1AD9|nr:growth/differentiation factor 15-like [Pristis pectinata]
MFMHTPHTLRYVATCLLLFSATCVDLRPHDSHRKWLQIEAVKRGILDYLGLEQPPVIRKSVSREEEEKMYQLFLQNSSSGRPGRSAESVTTLHVIPVLVEGAGDSGMAASKEGDFDQRLTFCFSNSSDIHPGLRVVRAELKLFQHLPVNKSLERLSSSSWRRVNVYEILEPTSPGGELSYQLLDSKALDTRPITNISLDVRPLIERWMGSGQQQVQVQLQFHPPHPDNPVLDPGSNTSNHLSLEIETKEVASVPRERRAASSGEDCRRRQRNCCRKSLRVSFKEIGWSDWIRAPESYNMYNCGGTCPANYKPANMHAMIKSAMHQLSGGASPALCCIPAAYEPMTLLHYSSEGTLTLTAFEGMIVTNCHCS